MLIQDLKPVVLGAKKTELAKKWFEVASRVNDLAKSSGFVEQKGLIGTTANHIRKLAEKK